MPRPIGRGKGKGKKDGKKRDRGNALFKRAQVLPLHRREGRRRSTTRTSTS